jgi:hypothetical protein
MTGTNELVELAKNGLVSTDTLLNSLANPQTLQDMARWATTDPDAVTAAFLREQRDQLSGQGWPGAWHAYSWEDEVRSSEDEARAVEALRRQTIQSSWGRQTYAVTPKNDNPWAGYWDDAGDNFWGGPLQEMTPKPRWKEPEVSRQPQVPNKMAQADPRWSSKVAYSSKELFARQQTLETYSVEVAMLIEAVRIVAGRALGTDVTNDNLEFIANFGSPITDNTQKISVTLSKPVELTIMLTRELVDGKLEWSADAGARASTPTAAVDRLAKARKDKSIPLDNMPGVRGTPDDGSRKRRKVTL